MRATRLVASPTTGSTSKLEQLLGILFVSKLPTGAIYQLPPTKILSFGAKRVLVSEAAVVGLALEREGIEQQVTKAGDFLKKEATQEWRSLVQQTEATTQRAKGQLNNLAGQAKERAQSLSNQTREKVQTLSEQLKEKTQTWIEQAREQSQDPAEQVKQAQPLNQPPAPTSNTTESTNLTTPEDDDDQPWI